jgi:hypothetical protein
VGAVGVTPGIGKWRIYKNWEGRWAVYAIKTDFTAASFDTWDEALAHVQAKQIEEAVQKDPLGALVAAIALLAAAQQQNQEQYAIEN